MNKKIIEYMKSQGIQMVRKANPTQGDTHVDQWLTSMSVAYIQDASKFVARRFFPVVQHPYQSDKYVVFNKGDFWRPNLTKRADVTETAGIDYTFSDEPFFIDVYGLHHDIGDQRRRNTQNPLNSDRNATTLLSQASLVSQDLSFANDFMVAGKWGNDYEGTADYPTSGDFLHWDDVGADPIGDVKRWKLTTERATGFEPNKLLLTKDVWVALTENPAMIERVKAGGTNADPARMLQQAITELFEIDEIMIMSGVVNTAAEGAADAIDFIAQKKGLLAYVTDTPEIEMPTAGYTFVWSDFYGAEDGTRMQRLRNDFTASDRVEIETSFDNKIVAPDVGNYMYNMIS